MALLDILKKSTSVYDPSKNLVTIAELPLTGVTGISITYQPTMSMTQGVSSSYNTFVRQTTRPAKVSVSLLNTSPSVAKLYQLHDYLRVNKGLFTINVVKNGEVVLIGNGAFETLPSDNVGSEADDITFSFFCDYTAFEGVLSRATNNLPLGDFPSPPSNNA